MRRRPAINSSPGSRARVCANGKALTDFVVTPSGPLAGSPTIPGDKSISHRAVLLGAIANGTTRIRDILYGEDVQRTINIVRACGAEVSKDGESIDITGNGLYGLIEPEGDLYCGNSGTAMRLLTGLFAGQDFPVRLTGDESLSNRPMLRVVEPLREMNAQIGLTETGSAPIEIHPALRLDPITWKLREASAQVKSAILLAGLYASGQTTVVEPTRTRDHTENLLESFGCPVERNAQAVSVAGGFELEGQHVRVPADFSSAAFFIVAAMLIPDSEIVLKGVGLNSTRSALLDVLLDMNASIETENHRLTGAEEVADVRVMHSPDLTGTVVNPELIPWMIDEIPILAVAAAFAKGTTVITGCEELRVKESDRIHSVVEGLKNIGVDVREQQDGMIIEGGRPAGGTVDSFADHRIAMAFAVAGAASQNGVKVENCACVDTSFPGFASLARVAGMDIQVEGEAQ